MDLFVIDVGNTSTMLGLFRGEELLGRWRIETRRSATSDEYALLSVGLLSMAGLDASEVGGAAISCVVPPLTVRFREMALTAFGCDAYVITPEDLGIPIAYDPPSAVGADRVANAVAAAALYRLPAIVVDFGTTTTVDVISKDGVYLGGAIAPGIEASVNALYAQAARLPRVELRAPLSAIGANTAASLRSGIVYGFAGQVDAIVGRCASELDEVPVVIATGGQAKLISDASSTIEHIDETLTLHGLRLLFALRDGHRDNASQNSNVDAQ